MVQDYTGPTISSIVVTVTSLDVTNSPQILTISFRATDTSGVKLNDLGRQGFEMGNNGYNFDNPYVLISGTAKTELMLPQQRYPLQLTHQEI